MISSVVCGYSRSCRCALLYLIIEDLLYQNLCPIFLSCSRNLSHPFIAQRRSTSLELYRNGHREYDIFPSEDPDYPDFDDSPLIMKAQREILKLEARASPMAQRFIEQENEDVDTPDIELEALLFRAKQSVNI